MLSAQNFYTFLIAREIYKDKHPLKQIMFNVPKNNYIETSLSDYVILQLFNHLHLLPFDAMVLFVINFATGMRLFIHCKRTLFYQALCSKDEKISTEYYSKISL